MIDFKDRLNWSEFDWERELRKDDARIATYISELPNYIDLPDEDGVIMNTLRKKPELAPTGGDWSDIGPVMPDEDDFNGDDDEEPDPHENDWQTADGGSIYMACAGLARDCAVCFASLDKPELTEIFMRILTDYAKIMARSNDLIDMDLEERDGLEPVPKALKIASCKRLLSDINDLWGELDKVTLEPASTLAAAHRAELGHVRENVLSLLMKYRSPV